MVLETEAAFPYFNWSIKMARIIWFGSASVGPNIPKGEQGTAELWAKRVLKQTN